MDKHKYIIGTMIGIIVLMNIIFVFLLVFSFPEKKSDKRELAKGEAVVTNIWLVNDSRIDVLRDHNVRYLFVDVGGTNDDGTLGSDMDQVRIFYDLIRDYEKRRNHTFVLLPYSEVMAYDVDTTTDEFKENYIQSYKSLVEMGFDGLLVDIEPVQFSQRDEFLIFLENLRLELGEDPIISVYAGHIGNGGNEWMWTSSFYKEVASRVDIISASGYDTDFTNADQYQNHLKDQIKMISTKGYDTNILFAIPAHKSYPEHSDIALEAVLEERRNYPDSPIIGTTVFAEWTADSQDWNNFEYYLQRLKEVNI